MPGFSCSIWDLVPRPGMEPRPPALGVQSLSKWTTREVPFPLFPDCFQKNWMWFPIEVTIPSLIHLLIKHLLKARFGTEYWEWSDKHRCSVKEAEAPTRASHRRRAAARTEACTCEGKSFMQTLHVCVCVLSKEGFH